MIELINPPNACYSHIVTHGEPTVDEICDFIKKNYPSPEIRSKVIWDFTNSSMTHLDSKGLRQIGKIAAHYRLYEHIAYAGSTSLNFGLLRMYIAVGHLDDRGTKYEVCRSMKEAVEWISHYC